MGKGNTTAGKEIKAIIEKVKVAQKDNQVAIRIIAGYKYKPDYSLSVLYLNAHYTSHMATHHWATGYTSVKLRHLYTDNKNLV